MFITTSVIIQTHIMFTNLTYMLAQEVGSCVFKNKIAIIAKKMKEWCNNQFRFAISKIVLRVKFRNAVLQRMLCGSGIFLYI